MMTLLTIPDLVGKCDLVDNAMTTMSIDDRQWQLMIDNDNLVDNVDLVLVPDIHIANKVVNCHPVPDIVIKVES